MPAYNGRGPLGAGPGTGWGLGPCGGGQGYGRRFMGRGFGRRGWGGYYSTPNLSKEEEKTMLSEEAEMLEGELKEIKARLERIEGSMLPAQAELQSLAKPEDIKGIGPSLGKELRGLGINSVGDFLTADPAVIGEKTRVSQEMAENLQSMGQLMMVPGVDANDAEMLLEAGIKSRKELADYDLIQLCKKVGAIAKVSVDQGKITKEESPSIEEISSWIRNA